MIVADVGRKLIPHEVADFDEILNVMAGRTFGVGDHHRHRRHLLRAQIELVLLGCAENESRDGGGGEDRSFFVLAHRGEG